MKRLLFVLVATLTATGPAAADSWTELHPAAVPPARHGHTLTRVGEAVLLFGGRGNPTEGSKPGPELNDVWSFGTDTFESLTPANASLVPRFGHAAAGAAGKLFVTFGFGDLQTRADQGAYDPAANVWETVPAGAVPPRVFHSLWGFPPADAYLYGGMSSDGSSALNDLWKHTPGGGWVQLAPKPGTGRYGHAAFEAGGKLYVFGGDDLAGYTQDLAAFDPAAGSWSALLPAGPPPPRCFPAVAAHGGKAWVFGGENAAGEPLADTWEYDAAANTWTRRTDMPVALAGSAAVVLPGEGDVRVLLFGGKGAGGTGLARLFLYRPVGFVAGDVNGNGVVDAMDFVLVAFWLSGIPGGLGLGMPLAADLDGSGAVNALDLLLLLLLIP